MEWFVLQRRAAVSWAQRFFLLAAGMAAGIILHTLLLSPVALAVDATWDGGSIVYQGRAFRPNNDESTKKRYQIEDGKIPYTAEVPGENGGVVMGVIVVARATAAEEATANYRTYDLVTHRELSRKEITLEPAGNGGLVQGECAVTGIGWFVCPAVHMLANMMDWMYGMLAELVKVPPISLSDQQSGTYIAWSIARNIANGAFIIAFLVIIYSQVTSVGISNYSIKTMLPRLVIAAVLVNLSYVICALAVDLSNIMGLAVKDAFDEVRNTVAATGTAQTATWGWGEWATAILSNGALGGGAAVGVLWLWGAGVELLGLLLPLLIGLGLILIVVLLIMAARHALIILLLIASPLAFVAYLLPGTEGWFEKWRKTLLTLLIFFPAFAAVFGGASLASILILQMAGNAVLALLGLAVQAAPLAITPILLKLSGGVLERFAGIVNDKRKGLYDRSKQFSKDWRTQAQAQGDAKADAATGAWGAFQRGRRKARRFAQQRAYNWKTRVKEAESLAENMHERKRLEKLQRHKRLLLEDMAVRSAAEAAEGAKLSASSLYDEAKISTEQRPSNHPSGRAMRDAITQIQQNAETIAVQGFRRSNNERAIQQQVADKMANNAELRQAAAGLYEFGDGAAMAAAITKMRSEEDTVVKETSEVLKHLRLSSAEKMALITKQPVRTASGHVLDPTNNSFLRDAALGMIIDKGTTDEAWDALAAAAHDLPGPASSYLASSALKNKAPFMGGKLIEDILLGKIKGEDDLIRNVEAWIANGKFKPIDLANCDAQAIAKIRQAIKSNLSGTITDDVKDRLKAFLSKTKGDKQLWGNITDAAQEEMKKLLKELS